nr:hypothetical protein [uncultured Prevotella sp.]
MSNNNLIFIDFPIKDYLTGNNIAEVCIRRPLSKPLRFLRKLPFFSRVISNTKERKGWLEECKGANTIILFDTFAHYATYCYEIENYVGKDVRLILYLLNPAFFSEDYKKLSTRWEIWTFMKEDAIRNGFKYGATFYNPRLAQNCFDKDSQTATDCDLLFVGTDKGRKGFLLNLKSQLKKNKVVCDFKIVDNFKSLFSRKYSQEISYENLCRLNKRTSAILDVVQDGQTGLTLRIMEGLLFDKKIVTTNAAIRTDKDFKDNPNIYVITKDNIKELYTFLKKPMVEYPNDLKAKYSFTSWLKRIDNNEEAE